jgi:DNA-binding LacI/PurR family transcriptional regulator
MQALQPHDLEIVLYNVDTPDHAHRRLLEVPRHQLEGLIILSLPLRSDEGNRLAVAQFPTVLIDTSHAALPSVVIDDRNGGRIATEHLLTLGHERSRSSVSRAQPSACVESASRERLCRRLADAGIAFDDRYVKRPPCATARRLANELFAMADPPTAHRRVRCQALGVPGRLAGKSVPRRIGHRLRRHRLAATAN